MPAEPHPWRAAIRAAFALVLLALGVGLYQDYGISWDEPISRRNGAVALGYLADKLDAPSLKPEWEGGLPYLHDYNDRDYGVAFELPAVALEKVLGLTDTRDVFMFRHLLTYLVFLGGVWAVWALAARRFGDWRFGLLAGLFLVLSPRMFAESFFNSKDLVFMALFAIATNTMVAFVLKPGPRTALVHALATALAIDVRIMAIALVGATLVLAVARWTRRDIPSAKVFVNLTLYLVAASALAVLFWVWLWADPWGNFVQALRNMAKFRWTDEVLFMGRFIAATELPWSYIPVWIAITTPLLCLGLFAIGLASVLRQLLSQAFKRRLDDAQLQDIAFLGLFFGPVLAVILLHSVLYDGWRQLYFVYPSFLLLAVGGWVALWRWREGHVWVRRGLLALTCVSFAQTATWMWQAHPMQNVYFNPLAGEGWRHRWDVDYWGLGNRKALEYILAHDASPVIHVNAASATLLETSFLMLPPADRARLRLSWDRSAPLYVVTNYRLVKEPLEARFAREGDLVYQLKVRDELILSVYKRKGT